MSASAPAALLVTELFPPAVGGSAVLFDNVYSRLSSGEVVVLTHVAGSAAEEEQRGATRVVRRPIACGRWGVLDPEALRHHVRLAAQIRRFDPQGRMIVHAGRALPEGVAALMTRLWRGTRYVCWAHGEDLACARTSRELTFLMTRVYRNAAAVIANSRNTAGLVQSLGVRPSRIVVVHPGVDAERFHPAIDGTSIRRELGRPDFLLLSVGRLQRRKGHDLAIAAVALLKQTHPSLKYIIVGDGAERPTLEALTDRLGVRDRVVFAGEVPDDQLPRYYAAADLFIMPNRTDGADIEGFGIVFLEAAASGKPAIGGRSGGVPEAVEHGETGLLVEGTDVNELAAAVRLLANSRPARVRMGQAGRERVLRSFTWERAAAAIDHLHTVLNANTLTPRTAETGRV